jgi:hypothetical protein
MIKTADVKEWLKDQLFDTPFEKLNLETGPDFVNTPEFSILITPSGGPGASLEGRFTGQTFQFRTIGRQGNPDSAEDAAMFVDAILTRDDGSRLVGGQWVATIDRFGAPPSVLIVDDSTRTHFVADYLWDVESVRRPVRG